MEKLDHLGWVAHQSYEIGETRFQIRTTSRALAQWLRRSLSRYRVTGRADPYYSIVVADDDVGVNGSGASRRFHILYKGTSQVVRSLDLPTVGRALLNEFEALVCNQRDDATYLDAGLVSLDGKTALISGALVSYLGRSVRHATRAGLLLPATRSLAIEKGSGQVSPVQPQLKLPRDSLARLAQVLPTNGTPERAFLERPSDVRAIFTYVAFADEPLQSIPRGRALHYFAANVMNFSMMRGEALESLGRVVQEADCYQLSDAPAREVIRTLSETLRSLSSN